jgi:hypothetical protein
VQAGDVTPEQLDRDRVELVDYEALPARFRTKETDARHAELRRRIREAEARLHAQPDLAALLDLPRTEAELRASWESWDVPERREWLRRVLEYVIVKPAPPGTHHRGSDIGARLDPRWKV